MPLTWAWCSGTVATVTCKSGDGRHAGRNHQKNMDLGLFANSVKAIQKAKPRSHTIFGARYSFVGIFGLTIEAVEIDVELEQL